MLTACAGSREPANLKVVPVDHGGFGARALVQNRHGHGARVDAAPPLGRRHALDAMAADFVTEASDYGELDRCSTIDDPVLVQSIDPVQETGIGRG